MPVHQDPEIPEIPKTKNKNGTVKHETVDPLTIPNSTETPAFLIPQGEQLTPLVPTPAEDEAEESEPLPEFDPKHQQTFMGLIYIGFLKRKFTWFGHVFEIKTLNTDEVLEVALACQPWAETVSDGRAYATAIAAACTMTVDGQPLPAPVTNQVTDTPFANRYEYVKTTWHPVTVDAVFNEYIKLERQVADVIEAMGKAVG